MMEKRAKIYVAGHNGMVGSAITRNLQENGYSNLVFTPYPPFDLTDQKVVADFFRKEKPEYVFLAAAKVGGIVANNKYRAQFIHENLMIQNNIIHQSYVNGVKKLLFLGSSCIYPRDCPQPIKEEYMLTGELEYTNEPYAIAKIAGIKMCESYNIQYGTNFISVMPTNLYGPNDNYNLETSHVLPALIRKMHLGKCLENNDWESIRIDLDKRPVETIDGRGSEDEISNILNKCGITRDNQQPATSNQHPAPSTQHPAPSTQHPAPSTQHPAPGTQHPESGSRQPATGDRQAVTITLWGTGSPYREFLHVDDVADACIFLMNNVDFEDLISSSQRSTLNAQRSPHAPRPMPHAIRNTHINIGTGRDLTIRDLALMIKDIVGFNGEIIWDTTKPDGTPKKLLDVEKLNALGWNESIKLEEGIRMVYEKYV